MSIEEDDERFNQLITCNTFHFRTARGLAGTREQSSKSQQRRGEKSLHWTGLVAGAGTADWSFSVHSELTELC